MITIIRNSGSSALIDFQWNAMKPCAEERKKIHDVFENGKYFFFWPATEVGQKTWNSSEMFESNSAQTIGITSFAFQFPLHLLVVFVKTKQKSVHNEWSKSCYWEFFSHTLARNTFNQTGGSIFTPFFFFIRTIIITNKCVHKKCAFLLLIREPTLRRTVCWTSVQFVANRCA